MNISELLIEYVKIDTKSEPESNTFPSSKKQFDLANLLVKQCTEMGLSAVNLDEFGYVTATLESNTDKNTPVLGLLAHMDTAPAMTGTNVNPQIIKDYDGKDIVLNEKENIILSPEKFPALNYVVGLDLIVTDGTTLLGADDKAGVAIIMQTMEYFKNHPEIPHGKIRIAFTPDKEIGKGVDNFNVESFGADFALTIDGSKLGEIQYECFNAIGAKVLINGESVHPGTAKNKMVNAINLAFELDNMLPTNMRPQYTEGYEAFYHLDEIVGNVEKAEMDYILRSFDYDEIQNMKSIFTSAVEFLNKKYGDRIEITFKESYRNMREKIEPHMDIVNLAIDTLSSIGVEPVIEPIRGGTDGSRLSWMGLPTPNIFTGGMNFHGKYEYIPIQHMEKSQEFLTKFIENLTQTK